MAFDLTPSIFLLSSGIFLQAVINYKWNAYARNIMLLQLGVYLIWLAAFTVFTFLYQVRHGMSEGGTSG